jgi:hypothetical protein
MMMKVKYMLKTGHAGRYSFLWESASNEKNQAALSQGNPLNALNWNGAVYAARILIQ